MKKFMLLILSMVLFLLYSCNKNLIIKVDPSEINTFISQSTNLPDFDEQCLLNGQVQIGIQTETLRFMLGEPKEIVAVQKVWGPQELWLYRNGGKHTFIIEDGGVIGIEEGN